MAIFYDALSSGAVLRPMKFPYPSSIMDRPEPRKIELQRRRAPTWLDPVIDSLGRLGQLPDNWDRRGSHAINPDDVQDALVFLQRVMRDDTAPPSIGPLNTGGIELSWNVTGLEVEAIFDRRRGETVLLVNSGCHEAEEPIESAEKLFAELVDRLVLPPALPA